MGHYCGASRRIEPGSCEIWLVNFYHCHHHGGGRIATGRTGSGPPGESSSEDRTAALLADILVDGLDSAVSSLVVEYLGKRASSRLRRRLSGENCQPIADAAKAVLDLCDRSHEIVGRAIGDLLPPDTSDLGRELTSKVAEKIPLPWDEKLKAVARGLQLIGIFACMVQRLTPAQCPCLVMLVTDTSKEVVKDKVCELIASARRELAGETARAA